ncbi:hypothetical protein MAPG_02684 [Magnaporthiopsis poae ATCC 64411]|uniref:Centromere protein H C-terminal domain-containing protein n=1 Tax=Magnaporthiopsis poae (strain ATCC 64411 / 73-15) TaxID=644358 RepID=A0A0C4DS14_MAGP6|nr:hypothetical protein MAPG_02684 [Magnaporthiopsis poae ATCC 64411]
MASGDALMEDAPGGGHVALFSNDEERILSLFDRLQELQLQIALIKARESLAPNLSEEDDEAVLDEAKTKLLETRASYFLRNQAVESVLSANPILNAIHGAKLASPIERDLEEPIKQRDAAAREVATQSTELHEMLDRLTKVESESAAVSRRNVELATEMLRLAEEAARDDKVLLEDDDGGDGGLLARLENELRQSRRRLRVMKGTASAVVVGSGVDWVRDPALRDMVLDPE